MPEEILLLPNERLDVNDARYGMKTFPVDMVKNLIHRTVSGDYRGGFVLEGFRVEINITDTSLREVIVHNGVAVDRDGQLITLEATDDFASNTDLRKSIRLDSTAQANYLMIEFDLVDSKKDSRVFIDPTFQNTPVTDSGGDTSPAPRGKEFTIDVPTRQASSWRIVSSNTGFDDVNDPTTGNRTLRIPIAIVPVSAGVIDTGSLSLERRMATVIRQPAQNATAIECSDTRHFLDLSSFSITDFDENTNIKVNTAAYNLNYRDNNVIAGFTNGGTLLADVRVGDRIFDPVSSANFLGEGTSHDCRPMLFALTDFTSDQREFTTSPTQLDEANFRNNKYYLGRSLLTRNNGGSAAFVAEQYPDTTGVFNRDVKWPTGGERSEHKLKTLEDQLIALGTIIREMKYGEQSDRFPDGSLTSTTTISGPATGSTTTLQDTDQYFDTSMVGGTLTITTGAAAGTYTITSVDSLHDLTFSPAAGAIVGSGETYKLNYRRLTADTQYVGNKEVGYLNEVYRARIDRRFNTYTNDIQERFRANKTALVTVGDGINTFGDYIGDAGLTQALIDVANLSSADSRGTIYVKAGTYTLNASTVFTMRSGTKVVGDGLKSTVINIPATSVFYPTLYSGESHITDIGFEDVSLIAAEDTAADVDGKTGVLLSLFPINNLTVKNCFIHGGSYNTSTELVNSWAIQFPLVAGSTNNNKNFLFDGCIFHFEGGGIWLNGCNDVKFTNCTFQTETSETAFVGLVEGVRIDGSTVANSAYGGTDALVPGEILFTGCNFRGRQTATSSTQDRGWIFVAPTYTGQMVKVTGCNFIGDIYGDGSGIPLHEKALTRDGTCLVQTSNSQLSITGSSFHSYDYGIILRGGKNSVVGNTFYANSKSVELGWPSLITYTSINSVYTLPANLLLEIIINDNLFSGYTASSRGIVILRNEATPAINGQLHAGQNTFKNLVAAFDADDLSTDSRSTLSNAVEQYSDIFISGNSINGCQIAFLSEGFCSPIADLPNLNYWTVENVTYINNSHIDMEFSSASDDAIVTLSGEYVSVSNNKFSEITNDSNTGSVIYINGGALELDVSGNTISECSGVGATLNSIKISISTGETNSIKVNNNIIDKTSANSGNVTNGILFTSYRTNVPSAVYTMTSNLMLNSNTIRLSNGNFAVLAKQDYDSSNVETFEWYSLIASSNKINIFVNSYTNFDEYSNDEISGLGVDYLNDRTAGITGYVGGIDLRRVSSSEGSNVVINNNNINIGGLATPADTTGNQDFNARVGIRVAKFSRNLDISNNTLSGSVLVAKWIYNTPDTVATQPKGGYYLKCSNNTVECYTEGVNIEINPATGYVDSTTSADQIAGSSAGSTRGIYTHLNLSGNIIVTDDAAPVAAYPFYGAARLWFPSTVSDGVASEHLHYLWVVSGNQLINSTFICDENASGSDLATLGTTAAIPSATNCFASLQFFNNVRAFPNTTATTEKDIFGITDITPVSGVGGGYGNTVANSRYLLVTNHCLFSGAGFNTTQDIGSKAET